MAEKPPAFQFYVRDWLGSESISLMSGEAVKAYMYLLCQVWMNDECVLPVDDKSLTILGRFGSKSATIRRRILAEIRPMLSRHGKKLCNEKLLIQHEELLLRRSSAIESGKRGSDARWGTHKKTDGETIATPLGSPSKSGWRNDGSSSSSATAVQSQSQNTSLIGPGKDTAEQKVHFDLEKMAVDALKAANVTSTANPTPETSPASLFGQEAVSWRASESAKQLGSVNGKTKYSAAFLHWYATYPRRIGKFDAAKAFRKLTITDRWVLEKKWPAHLADLEQRETQMVPYPGRFLRSRVWEDPPPEPRAGAKPDSRPKLTRDLSKESA